MLTYYYSNVKAHTTKKAVKSHQKWHQYLRHRLETKQNSRTITLTLTEGRCVLKKSIKYFSGNFSNLKKKRLSVEIKHIFFVLEAKCARINAIH